MGVEPLLTDRAQRLIARSIDSVGRLDVLLLVAGSGGTPVGVDDVAETMRAPRQWSVVQLEALEAAGLLRREHVPGSLRWTYDPADDVRAAAAELMTACHRDRPAVVRAVFAVRPSAARAFSDAFRLRRPR